MKKKITLFILITFTMICFSGCSKEEKELTNVNSLEVNRTSTDISNISLNNLSNNIVTNITSNSNTTNKEEVLLARFFH